MVLQVCDPASGRERCSPFWAFVAPALFILLWSGGFTALKAGLADAEPITYLALRYGVVLAVLTPLFLMLRPPLPRSPVEWGHQAVIGILVQTLYFGLAYLAMRLGVSAGLQALIVSLQPLWSASSPRVWWASAWGGCSRWGSCWESRGRGS